MKHLSMILLMIPLTVLKVSGQSPAGTLKIFTDEPLVVYVDDVHHPQYADIKLVPGSHYIKAINSNGDRVYSNIISVRTNEVTSVLIETPAEKIPAAQAPALQAPAAPAPASQAGVTYGQPQPDPGSSKGSNAGHIGGNTSNVPTAPATPKQTIDIGQVNGNLPTDMAGAFGLSFGMQASEVDRIMSQRTSKLQRNQGYYVYAIPYESTAYVVECRFIDQKLFQIIIGYPSFYTANSKLKLSKHDVPFPEFNRMFNDLAAHYGEPDTTERIFLGGYSEDDGRILEALKRKKALVLHNWTDPETGNNIILGLGYTTAPLAATIYTSGPLGAEAISRKLKLHGYDYKKSFTDNYFSN
jgi:hypothetical protein